jgi:hypothetical protein
MDRPREAARDARGPPRQDQAAGPRRDHRGRFKRDHPGGGAEGPDGQRLLGRRAGRRGSPAALKARFPQCDSLEDQRARVRRRPALATPARSTEPDVRPGVNASGRLLSRRSDGGIPSDRKTKGIVPCRCQQRRGQYSNRREPRARAGCMRHVYVLRRTNATRQNRRLSFIASRYSARGSSSSW